MPVSSCFERLTMSERGRMPRALVFVGMAASGHATASAALDPCRSGGKAVVVEVGLQIEVG